MTFLGSTIWGFPAFRYLLGVPAIRIIEAVAAAATAAETVEAPAEAAAVAAALIVMTKRYMMMIIIIMVMMMILGVMMILVRIRSLFLGPYNEAYILLVTRGTPIPETPHNLAVIETATASLP